MSGFYPLDTSHIPFQLNPPWISADGPQLSLLGTDPARVRPCHRVFRVQRGGATHVDGLVHVRAVHTRRCPRVPVHVQACTAWECTLLGVCTP